MSFRTLIVDWSLDGSVGLGFLVLALAAGCLYLAAARHGRQRDRRRRRWPRRRAVCFLAGLAALIIDLYSGIGSEADAKLSVHVVEHMVMWGLVAPLLAAGGPVRLALYALTRGGRRRLARWLHSPVLTAVTGPIGSVALFAAILLISHLPAVYGLALSNNYVHEAEHGVYLVSAVIMWAPLLGVDPLPHRPGPQACLVCMLACMAPMALIAIWWGSAASPVYGHYAGTLGPAALHDQRLAAAIMGFAGVPALAVPALARVRVPSRPWRRPACSFRAVGDCGDHLGRK